MDIDVLSAISSVGFPIVACIYLVWYGNKKDERTMEVLNELRKATESNTITIQKLIDNFLAFTKLKGDIDDDSRRD